MASSALSTVAGPAAAAVAVAVPPDSQKQQQKDQSPRNTASLSASPTVGGNATAYVQLGAIEVSKALQEGEKFIKWDEVSTNLS